MRVLLAALFVTMGLLAPAGTVRAADVNNFKIQDYQIDYSLGQDAEGRSTLKTVESINAVFPDFDQNHGIERAIPDTYDGHSTSLKIESVTDVSGQAHEFTTYSSNDNTVLRIGSADSYVHGTQTYKITYTQRDITKYFADNTNDDEFYWDTNGTDWAVPIDTLTVRLHVDEALQAKRNDKRQCYIGQAGSTDKCTIDDEGGVLVTNAKSLRPGENVTMAIGFQPHAFMPYKASLLETLLTYWAMLQVLTFCIAAILIAWYLARTYRRSNRTAEITVIVPEYLPPKYASVTVSAAIANKTAKAFSAQLIDFAVRHYVKIYQTKEKTWFGQAKYELGIIKDIANLKAEEREILEDIFGDPHVGARLALESLKKNTSVATKLSDNHKKLGKDISGQYALRAPDDKQKAWFKRQALIVLVAALLTLSPLLLLASIVALCCGLTLKSLTDKGLELARYLKGLEMYIKVAETERLRMLQSPEGAEKLPSPVDTNDKRQLIKLYEKVLPYAILFGQEKDWNKQLGQYYESAKQQPTWYSGHTAFNAAVFSTAISNFNTAATYSNPSSSSSGGSGGGGSSGGGGGGGGGGGW